MMKSKVIYISHEAERENNNKLVDYIVQSGTVNENTVLINCQPQFSSALTQFVNHKLSHLNNNSLLDQYSLEIPLKGMNQIWDPEVLEYQYFDLYLHQWMKKYTTPQLNYLFLTNILHSPAYNRLVSLAKGQELEFKVACVYLSTESALQPDFHVSKTDGRVLFEWENSDNADRIF